MMHFFISMFLICEFRITCLVSNQTMNVFAEVENLNITEKTNEKKHVVFFTIKSHQANVVLP